MGCGCIASQLKDKYTIEDIISTKYNSSQKEIVSTYPLSPYVKKVFYLINKIRTNPSEFIKVIEQAEKYIKEINGRKIFEDNDIKIALNEGISMFNDCKTYLNSIQPMDELYFCDEIVLECPTEENKINEKNFFKEKILEKKDKCGIKAYFRDSIYIPEISVLLMIIDDSVQNPRKKRECDNIVDKNKEENERNNGGNIYNNNEVIIKEEKININIKNEGKKKAFCAYFTLK